MSNPQFFVDGDVDLDECQCSDSDRRGPFELEHFQRLSTCKELLRKRLENLLDCDSTVQGQLFRCVDISRAAFFTTKARCVQPLKLSEDVTTKESLKRTVFLLRSSFFFFCRFTFFLFVCVDGSQSPKRRLSVLGKCKMLNDWEGRTHEELCKSLG